MIICFVFFIVEPAALGVQPSDQTPHLLNTLLEKVCKNLGAYPQITCSMPQKGILLLKEIRFCLKRTNKTLPSVVQNCPTTVGGQCTKPLTDYVWLRATPTNFGPRNVTIGTYWLLLSGGGV